MSGEELQKVNGNNVWLMQEAEAWAQERKDFRARLEAVERELSAAVLRRDSMDIGTAGKGGNFKHYLDPGASLEENDRLMAEEARNFVNGGGILPDLFSKRILAIAAQLDAQAARGLPTGAQ
jgi:hypothetical protein